jgi:hypothetical protein
MVVWLRKFRPHLLEKYDGTINPVEFLKIYSTSILTAGWNEAAMANYFPVALTGMTRSWLMNLPPGSLFSWEELCRQFTVNFVSSCRAAAPGGVAVVLHPAVLLGLKHHPPYLQRFCCCHVSTGRER